MVLQVSHILELILGSTFQDWVRIIRSGQDQENLHLFSIVSDLPWIALLRIQVKLLSRKRLLTINFMFMS